MPERHGHICLPLHSSKNADCSVRKDWPRSTLPAIIASLCGTSTSPSIHSLWGRSTARVCHSHFAFAFFDKPFISWHNSIVMTSARDSHACFHSFSEKVRSILSSSVANFEKIGESWVIRALAVNAVTRLALLKVVVFIVCAKHSNAAQAFMYASEIGRASCRERVWSDV